MSLNRVEWTWAELFIPGHGSWVIEQFPIHSSMWILRNEVIIFFPIGCLWTFSQVCSNNNNNSVERWSEKQKWYVFWWNSFVRCCSEERDIAWVRFLLKVEVYVVVYTVGYAGSVVMYDGVCGVLCWGVCLIEALLTLSFLFFWTFYLLNIWKHKGTTKIMNYGLVIY